MKKFFESPTIDVAMINKQDVITTSGNNVGEDDGSDDGVWV